MRVISVFLQTTLPSIPFFSSPRAFIFPKDAEHGTRKNHTPSTPSSHNPRRMQRITHTAYSTPHSYGACAASEWMYGRGCVSSATAGPSRTVHGHRPHPARTKRGPHPHPGRPAEASSSCADRAWIRTRATAQIMLLASVCLDALSLIQNDSRKRWGWEIRWADAPPRVGGDYL